LIPRFYDVELDAPATCDFMSFHVKPPTRYGAKLRDRTTAIVRCRSKGTFRGRLHRGQWGVCARFSRPKKVHISLDDLGQPDSHAGANTCERFKERIGSR